MNFQVRKRGGPELGSVNIEGEPRLNDILRLADGLGYRIVAVSINFDDESGNAIRVDPEPVGRIYIAA